MEIIARLANLPGALPGACAPVSYTHLDVYKRQTERSVRQLEQDQKVPLNYIGKVGVGIPVHNGGHVLGECVGNASSDGMKLK